MTADEQADLSFFLGVLQRCHRGVDLNHVGERAPDRISRTDACEFGLGGVSYKSGRAWRFVIPTGLVHKWPINFLEWLASAVDLYVGLLEGDATPGDRLLSIGDNQTAVAWLHKSNFDDLGTHGVYARACRAFAADILSADVSLWSQWLAGKTNDVADTLSRYPSLPDTELTLLVLSSCPTQVPNNFHIRPLPNTVTSWILHWLRATPSDPPASPPPLTPTIGGGGGGANSCPLSASVAILSSDNNPLPPASGPSLALRRPFDHAGIPDPRNQALQPFLPRLASQPLGLWVRPSLAPACLILGSTQPERLHDFYRTYTKAGRIRIQGFDNRNV